MIVIEVASDDYVARFLDGGTRPHDIKPRGGDLPFMIDGRVAYVRAVHHPGQRPLRIVARALHTVDVELSQIAREVDA